MTLFKRFSFHSPKKRYFEGIYYKLCGEESRHVFAVIPGYARSDDDPHAFIQIFNGVSGEYHYLRFPFSEYQNQTDGFRIGRSFFSLREIRLNIQREDFSVEGRINFSSHQPWPAFKNAMGPFSFFPFMECYYDVLSFGSDISGKLKLAEKEFDFSGGRGYLEKNWGRSFPSAWVWSQCNHFEKTECLSVLISLATIPYLGLKFPGFMCAVFHQGTLYPFTTYGGGKILKFENTDSHLILELQNPKHRLEIFAEKGKSVPLKSPRLGVMDGECVESLQSTIKIRLFERKSGALILEDRGSPAGLEVNGDVSGLI